MIDRHIAKLRHCELGLGLRMGLSGGSGISIPALDLSFINSETLDPRITFTRGSAGTRVNASGLIESITTNNPRFDYSPTSIGTRAGLLIEGQRTNLLLNSTIDGANLATQSVTVTAAAHTLSFYGTGTVTLSGVSSAGPAVGGGAYPTRTTLTFTPTAGSLTLTVTGTVQFANLELGAFASSYIPTAGSQATRAADVVSMTGANFSTWFNASEGTFITEFDTSGSAGNRSLFYAFQNGSNYIGSFVANTTNKLQDQVATAGAAVFNNASTASVTPGQVYRDAFAYKANDFARSFNAEAVATDTSGTLPAPTVFYFGQYDGSQEQLYGHIRSQRYYRSRLPNATLQQMSA